MNSLYFKILDFVFTAKKLEYVVALQYSYFDDSIFKGKIDKLIPLRGSVTLETEVYDFFFHGTGIDFSSNSRHIKYNHYSGKDGLGVYFTQQAIFESFQFFLSKDLQKEFDELIVKNLIRQWSPEIPLSGVFYLV
jgi:hypothetical protein